MSAISRRQVRRARGFARPLLPDPAQRSAVVRRLLRQYEVLEPAVPRLRAPMNRVTLRIAVDSLALYRALPEDMPRADRLALVGRFATAWMHGQFDSRLVRWVYRHRPTHLMLRRWWFWTANLLDEPGGWRFRYVKGGPGRFYGVDVTRCGIVRFLTDQGAPELVPLMCAGDFQVTAYLPPGVGIVRTGTLAEGAPVCDLRYPTADPSADPGSYPTASGRRS